MSLPCTPGSHVIVRDERWRVLKVDAFERCSVITLEAAGRARLRVIDPFDRIAPVRRQRGVCRRRRTVLQSALALACSDRPATSLWTASDASIDLLPYQLEPALAVLRGATRVLLADAVGLGKTIQAGMILAELRARGVVERALIVCPAGVRANWAAELQQRFGVTCAVLDQFAIAEQAMGLATGFNPWNMHGNIIASIDFIKRPEVLAALATVPIDLVIADEAHHLTPGTDRGEAVQALASRAPWCVLVTATPHSGDQAAFEYLTRLGHHGDPLTIFRRSRRDAGIASIRRERVAAMRADASETKLLDAVEKYTRAMWQEKGSTDGGVQLVAITIARRAASSLPALERTLRRRLQVLGTTAEPAQQRLPWDEDDEADGSGAAELLALPGLHSEPAERSALEQLLALIDGCTTTSKIRWITRFMRRLREPAIVFTEYRDTLDALIAAMPSGLRTAVLSGVTPIDARRRAVEAFNRGDVDVLLATDTAGEGLNLHHRCRLVIDVELPWNPLRLEQRLGRVDRLGQRRRVHAVRLFHQDSIEERVLDRLQARRARAEWLDHPPPIDERAMARSVFDPEQQELRQTPHIRGIAVGGVADENARLVRQRQWRGPRITDCFVAAAPKRRATSRMLALHAVTCVNIVGAIVAEVRCVHAVVIDGARLRSRRAVVRAVPASENLLRAVQDEGARVCAAIELELQPFRTAVAARIASIRSRLGVAQARDVQPSLFDRRAEETAQRADDTWHQLDAALERRRLSIESPLQRDGAIVRLLAAWPEHSR